MSNWDWLNVAIHGIAAAIEAGVSAGRAKRAQITGEAPALGWRERQAAADAAPTVGELVRAKAVAK